MNTLKRLIRKIVIKYLKHKRAKECHKAGHNFVFKTKFNGVVNCYCLKCKISNKQLAEKKYGAFCIISGKRKKVPLIKKNNKTVLVGISNKIIKRHIKKDCVVFV